MDSICARERSRRLERKFDGAAVDTGVDFDPELEEASRVETSVFDQYDRNPVQYAYCCDPM